MTLSPIYLAWQRGLRLPTLRDLPQNETGHGQHDLTFGQPPSTKDEGQRRRIVPPERTRTLLCSCLTTPRDMAALTVSVLRSKTDHKAKA